MRADQRSARWAWLVVAGLSAFVAAFAIGCGSDDSTDTSASSDSGTPTELGQGEGEVNLIAWAGYVEDGSTDPKVDWVSDFEKETGCKVNVKVGNTSDEMVQLMRTGQYDARLGLRRRDAAADRRRRRRPGQHRPGAQLRRRLRRSQGPAVQLGRRPDVRDPARPRGEPADVEHRQASSRRRRSWDVVFDGRPSEQKGQRHGLRQPDLHRRRGAVPDETISPTWGSRTRTSSIEDQFDAAIDLLKQQRQNIGEYWSDYTKEIQAFANGDIDGRHDLAGTST